MDLAERWAWNDPEAALEAAEKEPFPATRRRLIERVASVWAFARPEQIDRALKNVESPYHQNVFRSYAEDELEWRKQGNLPRDGGAAGAVRRPWDRPPPPTALTRYCADADTIRVLDNPKDTAWLKEPAREQRLREAADIAYRDEQNPETFWQIIAQFSDAIEPEDMLQLAAEGNSRGASRGRDRVAVADQIVAHVRSNRVRVAAGCTVGSTINRSLRGAALREPLPHFRGARMREPVEHRSARLAELQPLHKRATSRRTARWR